nr:MAG TPA: hypothetical protein [Caudoviricetes sp.]
MSKKKFHFSFCCNLKNCESINRHNVCLIIIVN